MKRKVLCAILSVLVVSTAMLGCSKGAGASSGESGTQNSSASTGSVKHNGKYKIALSNSFMGNDWRQLMIKTTEAVAAKDPYKDTVDLKVVNCENNAEAQAASIDALVAQGYNAILVDASSSSALIPSLERAMKAGVVCVSFDSVVNHKGVYAVQTDLKALGSGWANYLVKAMGSGKGKKIAVDTGLPGSTNGNIVYETVMKIFKDSGVNVVAEFAGEYSDGVGQKKISSILAANHDLDGIFTQVYGETIQAAFKQAGRPLIPATAYNSNAGQLAALDNKMNLCIGNNVPGLGAIALSTAVKVLNGEKVDQVTNIMPGFYVTDTSIDSGYTTTAIKENETCFRKLPGAFDWPALPTDFKPSVTVDEISDYQQRSK